MWASCWWPNETFLLVRNTEPNAIAGLDVVREEWEKNKLLQLLFPEVVPEFSKSKKWSGKRAALKRTVNLPQATYEAAGVGSTLTSRHFLNIIGDDLIAARENPETRDLYEPTRLDIDRACGFLRKVRPLLQDQTDSWFCNITTRWCGDDTVEFTRGWNLDTLEVDCYGEDGEPTYPERFPRDVLEAMESEMGQYLFMALMRNKPLSTTTRSFSREYLHYHDIDRPVVGMRYVIGIDPAGTKTGESDYFAIVVVGVDEGGKWYVVEKVNERMGHDLALISKRIGDLVEKWEVRGEGIALETNFFRGALKDELEKELQGRGLYCGVYEVKSSVANRKDDRILWLQPLWERRGIALGRGMEDMEMQLMGWRPQNSLLKYDDLIDALGMVRFVAGPGTMPVEVKKGVSASSAEYILWECEQEREGGGEDRYLEAVTGVRGWKRECPFDVVRL